MFDVADINECLVDNGGCSHGCVNTAGSHYCTCPRYLYLSDDNSTCTGKDNLSKFMKNSHDDGYHYFERIMHLEITWKKIIVELFIY
mgnify:FL=1